MATYGRFDPRNREYVITHPLLPQPWHNYMRNDEYCGLLTHTGGGTSFWKDPSQFRVLRYKFHLRPYDRPGRYVYIRDQDSGRYWSATWAPVQSPLSRTRYRCHVGMGYNRILTRYNGIEAEMLYFVPPDDAVEIWKCTLRNTGRKTRHLRTFSYAEFAVWGVLRDLLNIDNAATCARCSYDKGVIWHETPNDVGATIGTATWIFPVGYFTSNAEPCGYDGSRDHFQGDGRDESNPIVVETGEPTNLCANGLYPLGSLAHDWTLRPGEEQTVIYQLGVGMERPALRQRMRKYRNPGVVQKAFVAMRDGWEQRLATCQADTPDEQFNTVVNTWAPYQLINFTSTGVGVSPVGWGTGSSMGFRDNGQAAMAVVSLDADLARLTIRTLSMVQHDDGTLTKNFRPPQWEGEAWFLDGQAWYPLFVNSYLKETGDLDLLEETFPLVQSKREMPLREKLDFAMEVLWKTRGEHGLCITGHADWNDCLNPREMQSESVFNSLLFCAGCRAMEEIFTELDEPKTSRRWAGRRKRMADAIVEQAWDGEWFRRMFLAESGRVLGSRKSRPWGKIFLEPQVWAALCESLPEDLVRRAMDSAHEQLGTPFGLRIVTPPCPAWEEDTGSYGILNMGFKENGAVYSHCNAWAACAEAVMGRGEKALETFLAFQPIRRNEEAEIREIEPYILGAQVQAEPFIKPGRGRNPWVTGSCTWNYLAATKYILGLKGEYHGLRIDPCIPAGWDSFTARRVFRGGVYEVTVENPHGLCRGIRRIEVDGAMVEGNLAPLAKRVGQTFQIRAVLEE